MPGSLPAHISAIVYKTEPQDRLQCTAFNHSHRPHGQMSYYAAQTLGTATTLEDWARKMEAAQQADVAKKQLRVAVPYLAAGSPQQLLPGKASR